MSLPRCRRPGHGLDLRTSGKSRRCQAIKGCGLRRIGPAAFCGRRAEFAPDDWEQWSTTLPSEGFLRRRRLLLSSSNANARHRCSLQRRCRQKLFGYLELAQAAQIKHANGCLARGNRGFGGDWGQRNLRKYARRGIGYSRCENIEEGLRRPLDSVFLLFFPKKILGVRCTFFWSCS